MSLTTVIALLTVPVLIAVGVGCVLLRRAFSRENRMAAGVRWLVAVALVVPVVTVIPAIAWAWGRPILDMSAMIRYHGLVNAIGHVGLGLAAFAWGRPPSHSAIRGKVHRPS